MSTANIVRGYGVMSLGPSGKVKTKPMWSYGQAMHTATDLAEGHPDWIVWVETRIVIEESWEPVDVEVEEYRQRQKLAAEEEASHASD